MPLAALLALVLIASTACDDSSTGGDGRGAGGASGAAGSGGSGGGESAFPTEETACPAAGAIACPGDPTGAPAGYSLRCVSGAWVLHETCATGDYCSTHDGPEKGRCLPPFTGCVGKKAGVLTCDGRTSYRCGAEPLSSAKVEDCPSICTEGEGCTIACPTGTKCTTDDGKNGFCTNKAVCVALSGG